MLNKERLVQKTLPAVLFGVFVLLFIGIGITKVTVHDLIPVDADRSCIDGALNKPLKILSFEWLIRATGATQVVSAMAYGGEARVYTLFDIPLDLFTIRIACDPALKPVTLIDGQSYGNGMSGVFRDSPVVGGLKSFSSDALGISFNYPTGFVLFEYDGSTSTPAFHDFVISPEEPMRQALARAQVGFGGDGPASMDIVFYRKDPSLSLEQWMRTDTAHSNFDASDATNALASTTVAGIPGYKYHLALGLYDTNYVLFPYGAWVVLAVASDMGPNTAEDFQTMLSSIKLR